MQNLPRHVGESRLESTHTTRTEDFSSQTRRIGSQVPIHAETKEGPRNINSERPGENNAINVVGPQTRTQMEVIYRDRCQLSIKNQIDTTETEKT